MDSQPHVPYPAYKSKRHMRTSSNPHMVPNVSPPPMTRPSSLVANFSGSTLAMLRNEIPSLPPEQSQEQASRSSLNPQAPAIPTAISAPHNSPEPPPPDISQSTFQLSSSVPVTPSAPVLNGLMKEKAKLVEGPSSMPATPSTQPTDLPNMPVPAIRKTSTFRRVTPRSTRPAIPSSPLRPTDSHSRTPSTASAFQLHEPSRAHAPVEPRSRITSLPSATSEKALPVISPDQIRQGPLPENSWTPQRSSSLAPPKTPSKTPPPVIDRHPSTSSMTAESPAPTSSALPASALRSMAPYRPGFQPRGFYRPRTDEYIELRNSVRDVGRIERTKLERRLEKLIDLHFPVNSEKAAQPPPANRRASSFFDFNISDLKNMDAGGLWKGMLQSPALQGGVKSDIRAAEQRITPWQDDVSVSKCPLCSSSFHPLSNRKHHCRLCGQIICSLPPKQPQRPVSCSLLFVVDPKTRRIEEVGEGVDYGVRKRRSSVPQGKGKEKEDELLEDEKFLKGVRICRECRHVLLRQQYRYELRHVPAFVKLYQAFVALEKEIEESLPQFQELILSLSHEGQPTKEASAARKRLLEAFAQYDALSKRISQLPCPDGPTSSQYRVQMAIHARANLFLQQNMFPLQSLPKPKKTSKFAPTEGESTLDPDSELALALQPLLEQEALLESYVEEAKARRKFEDAKTLKANLVEIRAEIDRMFASAESGAGRQDGKAGTSARSKI